MSNVNKMFARERREDPYVTSFNKLLAFAQRAYDMTGQPDIREMIDEARAVAGRVPRDLSRGNSN